MAINEALVLRAAGWSALGAVAALILAGATFALFLNGAGATFGPLNDMFTALALGLLALPICAVWILARGETGTWFGVVSLLALIGIVVAACGQLLLVGGFIQLETSFVTGTIGLVPLLVWAVSLAIVAFRLESLPDAVGWLTLAVLGLTALMAVGSALTSGIPIAVLSAGLLLALSAWLVALSSDFLARA